MNELRQAVDELIVTIEDLKVRVTKLEQQTVPVDPTIVIPVEDILSKISESLAGLRLITFPVE